MESKPASSTQDGIHCPACGHLNPSWRSQCEQCKMKLLSPDGPADDLLFDIEASIAKKARGSLIYTLLGIFGFTAILLCPLAYIHANQALHLIDKYQVGKEHRGTANAARIGAPIIFLFYTAIAVIVLVLVIRGGL